METGSHVIFMELHFVDYDDDDGDASSTCKLFKRRSAFCTTIPLLNCVRVSMSVSLTCFYGLNRWLIKGMLRVMIKTSYSRLTVKQ